MPLFHAQNIYANSQIEQIEVAECFNAIVLFPPELLANRARYCFSNCWPRECPNIGVASEMDARDNMLAVPKGLGNYADFVSEAPETTAMADLERYRSMETTDVETTERHQSSDEGKGNPRRMTR